MLIEVPMPNELWERLEKEAKEEGKSVNEIIEDFLEKELDEKNNK
jgi:predicted HicB family RNase H-like nuclease